MSQSPIAKDVVLLIGEKSGTRSVDTQVQTGTTSVFSWDDVCGDFMDCERTPVNHLTGFSTNNFPRSGFGMKITEVRAIGQTSFASHIGHNYDSSMGNNPTDCGYPYMVGNTIAPENNMTLIFTMQTSDGNPAEFNGINNSKMNSSNGAWVDNHVYNNNEDTEQGRILYLQPTTGASFSNINGQEEELKCCLSFEILDGCNDQLLVRGTGMDAPWDWLSQQTNGEVVLDYTSFYEPSNFLRRFDCYISPYAHKANWEYKSGRIEYNRLKTAVHMSYIGSFSGTTGTQWEWKYSPMFFGGQNRFAIRSKQNLLTCMDESGALINDSIGCRIVMNITELVDCELRVLYGNTSPFGLAAATAYGVDNNGIGGSSSTTPWTWTTITSAGTHEICVPYAHDPCYDLVYGGGGTFGGMTWHNPTMVTTNMKVGYGGGGAATATKRFFNTQTEFFEVVETGLNPSIKISKFEVYNNNPLEGTTTVPVYTTQSISVDVFEYQHLDILDRDQNMLALNFTSADLRDPSKRAAGFSKTFEIPASNHNQQWLNTMTAVGSHRDKDKISWHKAKIQANGIPIFQGYARIEQSVTGDGGRYKCHILQDPTYWPELLKGLSLCDLGFPTHEKTYANITSSWTKNWTQVPYVYPAISYGCWSPGTNAAQTPNQPKSLRDFHPAVYVRSIVDKIFESIGYNLSSDFMNTTMFTKLIIPFTSGEEYDANSLGGSINGEGGNFSVKGSRNAEDTDFPNVDYMGAFGPGHKKKGPWYPIFQFDTDPANIYAHNTSHSSGGGGYTVPFTGRYTIMYDARVRIKQGGPGYGKIAVWPVINGKVIYVDGSGTLQHKSASNAMDYFMCPQSFGSFIFSSRVLCSGACDAAVPTGPPYNVVTQNGHGSNYAPQWTGAECNGDYIIKDIDFEIDLQQGDVVNFAFGLYNTATWYTSWNRIKEQNFGIWPSPGNTAMPASTVSLASALPCTKQVDFLKGITNLFNLHWTSDESTKTVFVEPYDDFYSKGKVLNWTGKLDKKSWSDKFLIDELAREIDFKYKVDTSDKIVERRNESMFNAYGSPELYALRLENGELYRKEDKDMGNKTFSPTFRIKGGNGEGDLTFGISNTTGPKIPCMWGDGGGVSWGWFNGTTRPDNTTKFNIRILNYFGIVATDPWQLVDNSGNAQTQNAFPYAYTHNEYYGSSVYGYEDNLAWHNTGGQRGLFDRYYARLYEKISGGAALRSCMMNLTPNDIAQIDMRDIVRINIDGVDTYWTINKIIDYKPGRDELTKVELIEWKLNSGYDSGKPIGSRGGEDEAPRKTSYGGNNNGDRKISEPGGMTLYTSATKQTVNNEVPVELSNNDKKNKGYTHTPVEPVAKKDYQLQAGEIDDVEDRGDCIVADFTVGGVTITAEVYTERNTDIVNDENDKTDSITEETFKSKEKVYLKKHNTDTDEEQVNINRSTNSRSSGY